MRPHIGEQQVSALRPPRHLLRCDVATLTTRASGRPDSATRGPPRSRCAGPSRQLRRPPLQAPLALNFVLSRRGHGALQELLQARKQKLECTIGDGTTTPTRSSWREAATPSFQAVTVQVMELTLIVRDGRPR